MDPELRETLHRFDAHLERADARLDRIDLNMERHQMRANTKAILHLLDRLDGGAQEA
jgi:hypothetical protein